MNETAFLKGAESFCKQSGANADQMKALALYKRAYDANPEAFVRGMAPLMQKAAAEDDTWWDRVRPWLLGIGGLALAAGAGSMWGRWANAHGYEEGPIVGPFKAVFRDIAKLPSPLEARNQIIRGVLGGADPAAAAGFHRAYLDAFQHANGAEAAATRALAANIDTLPKIGE